MPHKALGKHPRKGIIFAKIIRIFAAFQQVRVAQDPDG